MLQLFHKIKRKIELSKLRGKVKDMSTFLGRISILLKEGYTFSDSISMLLPYHVDQVHYWNNTIQEKLRNGEDVVDILKVFPIPSHYLIAVKIAEENGEMASALEHVARQINFNEKMRKKLLKLLSYPLLLMVVLTTVFIAFRTYFLPSIHHIVSSRQNEESSNLHLSSFFLHLPDYLFATLCLVLLILFVFLIYFKKLTVAQRLDLLTRIPVINYFYRLIMTRQLSNTLGNLLVSGLSLQQALNILQRQQFNQYLAHVSSILEKQVIYGDSLSQAISKMSYFFQKFEDFIKHGEKSGYLGRELLIYCELLDERLQSIIKTSLSIVQPALFVIIAVCIIAAYLSVLLPMYELIEIL
ncbi:competence type IV pilus assembly protein ComGB [Lysinibacillus sp. BW-2-10]|uniref:competence type IV pilus assembly protein ComGB n=1 Tax=Lysinibacillus sp. BW-2-10 TaxID=2590030 RepID=UPI00117FB228|nr:competence type IV pilus assembly protein ComGB [Lysinibacillus sp. BW-2-10]TSI08549.1 type II secretory pathway protein [Lysinibacillus sp. BW-2-10]